MNTYQDREEFSGDEFKQIMLDDKNSNQLTNDYLTNDFQRMSANLQSQIRRDLDAGKPSYRHMIPNYFYSNSWLMSPGNKGPNSVPFYVIRGAVVLGPAKLDSGLIIRRCLFTDEFKLDSLFCSVSIMFSNCIFDKGITIDKSEINDLLFWDMPKSFDLRISNSKFGKLNINRLTNDDDEIATRKINPLYKSDT